MPFFALYLPPEVMATSTTAANVCFEANGHPFKARIREELLSTLGNRYPSLPVRRVPLDSYTCVHSPAYLDALRRLAAGEPMSPPYHPINHGLEVSLPGYEYALGGAVTALEAFRAGKLERAYVFGLGGHHAFPDWPHGYCLLNSAAAAARHAQTIGFHRIVILDWDIHHGDGTQAIFAHDRAVHCISIHDAAEFYMAKASEIATGLTAINRDIGHRNIPLLSAAFSDTLFDELELETEVFRADQSLIAVEKALDDLPFAPDLIILFAGCDSHRDDCGMGVTDWSTEDFATLTAMACHTATLHHCPILSFQGGGYRLETTIAAASSHIGRLEQR